jgi:two-component system CheB/CheR fusion protein
MHSAVPTVVGIGASAGGLEPILEFVGRLPIEPALAVLVVQHLDPSQPSLLVDILARHSLMPVRTAVDGEAIAGGTVTVIAPNTRLTVRDGRLSVTPRAASALGPPMPIDDLLASLATECETDAIGIVLSGAGTDGALGLQAIKALGGLTFAQDEASARFASMPRAAVALGCVDRVLAPAAMADEVLRIVRHRPPDVAGDPAPPQEDPLAEEQIQRVFAHLLARCDVDFSHYKRGTVLRRLVRRIALTGQPDLAAYATLVGDDAAEAQALCRDLLIRYTEFFRDPGAFEALTETALPRLMEGADPSVPLRIWVPGCASGEEVYSIAICVSEFAQQRSLPLTLQILGTDVSEDALHAARQGRYLENIARSVSPERLARFFTRDGDFYRVAKPLRDCCTFARQNVAYDPPFSRIDLVSCRNLLIYMDPVLQKRVMPAFHFALRPEGVLMLGLSETVGTHSDLFAPLDSRKGRLYSRKALASRGYAAMPVAPPPAAGRTRAGPVARTVPQPDLGETLRREADRIALARYAPAAVLCDEDFNVLEFRGETDAFLAQPNGAPTRQLMRLARPGAVGAIGEATRRAKTSDAAVRVDGVLAELGAQRFTGCVEVVPMRSPRLTGRWFLVTFPVDEAVADGAVDAGPSFWRSVRTALGGPAERSGSAEVQAQVQRLQGELQQARDQARVMLEDHEAAVEALTALEEETQAANEEFQSTNEELETAKEELQSLNEELSTTNDELRYRNRELKTMHEQVSQSRDYADAIIETMSQPLLVLDASLRVLRANEAFYRCFRTTPRETLQVGLYALGIGQWDVPGLRKLLAEMLPQRAQIREHELSAVFPALGPRRIRLNAARLAGQDAAMILLTIDDVTERHATLDALSQADRQKDEFLVMLAHELRNPLAGMNNALHLLQHPSADEAARGRALQMLDRQLGNQVRMVDDLLDLSRITRGLVVLQREAIDLGPVLQRAREALRSQIDAHGHAVTMALPAAPVRVDGDPVRLEQVMTNLIGNAIKYTPPNGRLALSLLRDGDDAVLEVRDNGIGMTPQLVQSVFSIFVRAPSSMELDTGGLGIGLSVVRRIVELHGGTVQAASEGLGHGSRFVVRLPALREAAAPTQTAPVAELPPAPPPVPVAPQHERVLVVDDNVDAGQGIATLLALDGFTMRIVQDGPSALRERASFHPDAVVLDLGLPGMDGYEVCRRLRHDDAALLIIVVSGFGRPEEIDRSRAAGADHHLTKPAEPDEIAALLRSPKRV